MKLILLLSFITLNAQDSLICVDRLGLQGTLIESDSLKWELEKQQEEIALFENDTTQAKNLIRAQSTHIKTLKVQRLTYKRNWIKSERSSRFWKDVSIYGFAAWLARELIGIITN